MKPPAKPKIHKLPVGEGHTLHIEESGNPRGIPVIILHGGPGGCISDSNHKRFPPQTYRLIAFDQRGCGKSRAEKGILHANTTQHTTQDIEKIRTHLNLEKWVVGGASWGSTLALLYAQAYPQRVLGLLVSSIFLATPRETDWFSQPIGLARFFPQEYAAIVKFTGANPAAIAKKALAIVTGANKTRARQFAKVWGMYEALAATTTPNRKAVAEYLNSNRNLLKDTQVFVHYEAHHLFLQPGQIIKNAASIHHIPTAIIHGELDMVCPPESALSLHAALPKSSLTMLPLVGHYGHPLLDKHRRAAAVQMAVRLKKTKQSLARRKK